MDNIIGKILPWIGAAVTGGVPSLIGMAAKELSTALGSEVDANAQAISKAVQTATPEQLLAIRQAEDSFKLRMQELGYKQTTDLYELEVKDRSDARAREIAVRDSTPRTLAMFVTLGFFGVLVYMLVYGTPANGGEALLVMLGSLGTAWSGIVQYYYGSSAGSRAKDVDSTTKGK